MTGTTDGDDNQTLASNKQILEIEYERARERLSEQQETLKEFSREGLKIFRLFLLFIAAPIALLGALDPQTLFQARDLLISGDCAIFGLRSCAFSIKAISSLTGVFLVMCAGMNLFASGYEARGVYNATNPEDINEVISDTKPEGDYWKERLKAYQKRIDHNDRIIWVKESLLVLGKVTFLLSIFGIVSIIAVVMNESPLRSPVWLAVLVLFLSPSAYLLLKSPPEYRDTDVFSSYSPLYDNNYKQESDDAEIEENTSKQVNSEDNAEEENVKVANDG